MHIPVRMGLVGQKGAALPLTLEGENHAGPETRVLELTENFHRFVFVDVAEEPLLSLGRNFSAPAIFRTSHSRHEPRHPDGQGQRCFQPLGSRPDPGRPRSCWKVRSAAKPAATPAAITSRRIGDVLARAEQDPAFAAQMLMPPTESELAARKTPVDPVGIHTARVALVRAIALAHRDRLAQLYEHMRGSNDSENGDFSPDAKDRQAAAPCATRPCAISPPRTTKPPPGWPTRITAAPTT